MSSDRNQSTSFEEPSRRDAGDPMGAPNSADSVIGGEDEPYKSLPHWLHIERRLGPPPLAPGEDLAAFRQLEHGFAERYGGAYDSPYCVEIRALCSATWEAGRYRRARDQMLREAIALQVGEILPAQQSKGVIADMMRGRAGADDQIADKLAKAKSSYDICFAAAMATISPRYEALSKLIDAADKKARDIERHIARRDLDRIRISIAAKRAWDLGLMV